MKVLPFLKAAVSKLTGKQPATSKGTTEKFDFAQELTKSDQTLEIKSKPAQAIQSVGPTRQYNTAIPKEVIAEFVSAPQLQNGKASAGKAQTEKQTDSTDKKREPENSADNLVSIPTPQTLPVVPIMRSNGLSQMISSLFTRGETKKIVDSTEPIKSATTPVTSPIPQAKTGIAAQREWRTVVPTPGIIPAETTKSDAQKTSVSASARTATGQTSEARPVTREEKVPATQRETSPVQLSQNTKPSRVSVVPPSGSQVIEKSATHTTAPVENRSASKESAAPLPTNKINTTIRSTDVVTQREGIPSSTLKPPLARSAPGPKNASATVPLAVESEPKVFANPETKTTFTSKVQAFWHSLIKPVEVKKPAVESRPTLPHSVPLKEDSAIPETKTGKALRASTPQPEESRPVEARAARSLQTETKVESNSVMRTPASNANDTAHKSVERPLENQVRPQHSAVFGNESASSSQPSTVTQPKIATGDMPTPVKPIVREAVHPVSTENSDAKLKANGVPRPVSTSPQSESVHQIPVSGTANTGIGKTAATERAATEQVRSPRHDFRIQADHESSTAQNDSLPTESKVKPFQTTAKVETSATATKSEPVPEPILQRPAVGSAKAVQDETPKVKPKSFWGMKVSRASKIESGTASSETSPAKFAMKDKVPVAAGVTSNESSVSGLANEKPQTDNRTSPPPRAEKAQGLAPQHDAREAVHTSPNTIPITNEAPLAKKAVPIVNAATHSFDMKVHQEMTPARATTAAKQALSPKQDFVPAANTQANAAALAMPQNPAVKDTLAPKAKGTTASTSLESDLSKKVSRESLGGKTGEAMTIAQMSKGSLAQDNLTRDNAPDPDRSKLQIPPPMPKPQEVPQTARKQETKVTQQESQPTPGNSQADQGHVNNPDLAPQQANHSTSANTQLPRNSELSFVSRFTTEQIQELQEMVARALQNRNQVNLANSETNFSWSTPEFGEVKFRIGSDGSDVRVEVSSSRTDVVDTIDKSRAVLEKVFLDQGMKMQRFEVQYQPTPSETSGSNSSFQQRSAPRDQQSSGGTMVPRPNPETGQNVTPRSERRVIGGKREWVA